MKKLVSVLLVALLVMAMAVPVFAAGGEYTYDSGTGRITGEYKTDSDKDLVNTYLDGNQSNPVGANKISVNVTAGKHTVEVYVNGKLANTYPVNANLLRVAGANRYGTSTAAADALKTKLGVSKFNTIIVAYGDNFADALSGTYLAGIKDAPILLVNKSTETQVINKVKADLVAGGQVYLLGGTLVVSSNVESQLRGAGYNVKRLAGTDRYGTNLAILQEAGVKSGEVLVCSGANFADALSASAAGKPIMLVGKELTAAQKTFLAGLSSPKFDIIGGNYAVVPAVETGLKAYGGTERVAGQTRYDTSVAVARKFFPSKVDTVVLAYGMNFPDGLSGGPLGVAYKAPVLLVTDKNYSAAAQYAKGAGATSAVIMGGTLVIPEATARAVVA